MRKTSSSSIHISQKSLSGIIMGGGKNKTPSRRPASAQAEPQLARSFLSFDVPSLVSALDIKSKHQRATSRSTPPARVDPRQDPSVSINVHLSHPTRRGGSVPPHAMSKRSMSTLPRVHDVVGLHEECGEHIRKKSQKGKKGLEEKKDRRDTLKLPMMTPATHPYRPDDHPQSVFEDQADGRTARLRLLPRTEPSSPSCVAPRFSSGSTSTMDHVQDCASRRHAGLYGSSSWTGAGWSAGEIDLKVFRQPIDDNVQAKYKTPPSVSSSYSPSITSSKNPARNSLQSWREAGKAENSHRRSGSHEENLANEPDHGAQQTTRASLTLSRRPAPRPPLSKPSIATSVPTVRVPSLTAPPPIPPRSASRSSANTASSSTKEEGRTILRRTLSKKQASAAASKFERSLHRSGSGRSTTDSRKLEGPDAISRVRPRLKLVEVDDCVADNGPRTAPPHISTTFPSYLQQPPPPVPTVPSIPVRTASAHRTIQDGNMGSASDEVSRGEGTPHKLIPRDEQLPSARRSAVRDGRSQADSLTALSFLALDEVARGKPKIRGAERSSAPNGMNEETTDHHLRHPYSLERWKRDSEHRDGGHIMPPSERSKIGDERLPGRRCSSDDGCSVDWQGRVSFEDSCGDPKSVRQARDGADQNREGKDDWPANASIVPEAYRAVRRELPRTLLSRDASDPSWQSGCSTPSLFAPTRPSTTSFPSYELADDDLGNSHSVTRRTHTGPQPPPRARVKTKRPQPITTGVPTIPLNLPSPLHDILYADRDLTQATTNSLTYGQASPAYIHRFGHDLHPSSPSADGPADPLYTSSPAPTTTAPTPSTSKAITPGTSRDDHAVALLRSGRISTGSATKSSSLELEGEGEGSTWSSGSEAGRKLMTSLWLAAPPTKPDEYLRPKLQSSVHGPGRRSPAAGTRQTPAEMRQHRVHRIPTAVDN
ncbi:hypothetical protein IAU60_000244 [Kwoniella sp. DSM 27419]